MGYVGAPFSRTLQSQGRIKVERTGSSSKSKWNTYSLFGNPFGNFAGLSFIKGIPFSAPEIFRSG